MTTINLIFMRFIITFVFQHQFISFMQFILIRVIHINSCNSYF